MNMEIFAKDFSGTTLPRILKFSTSIKYDKLIVQCIEISDTYCLSVPSFVYFLSFQLKWLACDGYRQGYVSFAHFLLYFLANQHEKLLA